MPTVLTMVRVIMKTGLHSISSHGRYYGLQLLLVIAYLALSVSCFVTNTPFFRTERTSYRLSPRAAAETTVFSGNVTLLQHGEDYLVVNKPPSVVCHHSEWKSSRILEVPMLQRTRQAVGRRVNLVHRLDRGCSGCLLFTYTDDDETTARWSYAMTTTANKTYLALVRGEGILHGRDLKQDGWFLVDRPIRNRHGILKNATTWFRFVAGQDGEARASLVLARPLTGRWHQIRRHLNGLSHPILGDSTHGNSQVNREWKRERGLLPERICLHLLRLQVNNTIDAHAELAPDMMDLLREHLPKVLKDAQPILEEEGIRLESANSNNNKVLPFEIYIIGEET
jgi:tRNA pseudouridine65 synthase